ncbi:MAPEG family protein [Brevundimonas staleyi]|uniref:MAPEG family protein n=1 Tax=Brevundimonas staleyi TaxID=74326 RepID=A0ABW0FSD8_9CAUL
MDVLTSMTPTQATALWTGLMVVLLVILGVRVAFARRSGKVLLGDGGNEQVLLASRVFGNAAEYIPVAVGALLALTLLGASNYILHILGGLLFVGRVIHAAGLSTKGVTAGRLIGMSLTWLPLLFAGAMLVVHAFVGMPHG